jgi:D-specific alpha-keto acid dehydrogenase
MHITIFGCELDEAAVFREHAAAAGITPVITAQPVSLETIRLARGSLCVSIGHKSPITPEHLVALHEAGVRYISTRSIGFNHVDVDFAASLGIEVQNVAYSPDSVADHTLMLMLMSLRQAKSVVLRAAEHDYRLGVERGRELRDLTVGVVGTGRIGSAVVTRLAGFGARVLATDTRQTTSAHYLPLDELLRQSDVVSLHLPLDEGSHHLLDERALALLPPGAVVVNTGRGSLIDTPALLAALESGRLGGAALDVVEGEEGVFYADRRHRPIDDEVFARLQSLPTVLITPHVAYYTDHALTDLVLNSLTNCTRFEKGLQHA